MRVTSTAVFVGEREPCTAARLVPLISHGPHRPPAQQDDAGEVAAAASARQQHPSQRRREMTSSPLLCVGRAHTSTCGAVDACDAAGSWSMDGWRKTCAPAWGRSAVVWPRIRMPAAALC